MRTDIGLYIDNGEVRFVKTAPERLYEFQWAGYQSQALIGEITIPTGTTLEDLAQNCYVKIPYTQEAHAFIIRFKEDSVSGNYLREPIRGVTFFNGWGHGHNGEGLRLTAAQLIGVSTEQVYRIVPTYDPTGSTAPKAWIYDGSTVDFQIINANTQNTDLMLLCNPSNNYRYPTMGVGLKKWIQSNTINSDLIDVLKNEFENDGTPVISAKYNFDTEKLNLQLSYDNV